MEAYRKAREKKGSRSSRRRNLIKDIQELQSKHLEAKIVMAREEMMIKHSIKMQKASLKELEEKLVAKGGDLGEIKGQRKALKYEEEERRTHDDIKPWQVKDRVQNTQLRLQERLIKDHVAKLGKEITSKKNRLSKLTERLSTLLNQPTVGSINWTPMEMTFKEPHVPTPSVFYPKSRTLTENHVAGEETIKYQKQVALVECEHSKISNTNANEKTPVDDMLLCLDEESNVRSDISLMTPSVCDTKDHVTTASGIFMAMQQKDGGCLLNEHASTGTLSPTKPHTVKTNEATPVQPFNQIRHSLEKLEINPSSRTASSQMKEAIAKCSYAEIYGLPFEDIKRNDAREGVDKSAAVQRPYHGHSDTGPAVGRGGCLSNGEPVRLQQQNTVVTQSHELCMFNTVPADYYCGPDSPSSSVKFLGSGGGSNSNNNGSQSANHSYRACTAGGTVRPSQCVDWREAVKEVPSGNPCRHVSPSFGRIQVSKENDIHIEDLDC